MVSGEQVVQSSFVASRLKHALGRGHYSSVKVLYFIENPLNSTFSSRVKYGAVLSFSEHIKS